VTEIENKAPLSLAELRALRVKPRNVFKEVQEHTSRLDRTAVWITEKVGTMGFFLVIFTWTVCWLGWNLLAPKPLQFDPPMGFILWLFISNLIQILLMPLIMVGQNIQGHHAEKRADYDLEVNVKSEKEIEAILYHLELQNNMLTALIQKQGITLEDIHQKQNQRES